MDSPIRTLMDDYLARARQKHIHLEDVWQAALVKACEDLYKALKRNESTIRKNGITVAMDQENGDPAIRITTDNLKVSNHYGNGEPRLYVILNGSYHRHMPDGMFGRDA